MSLSLVLENSRSRHQHHDETRRIEVNRAMRWAPQPQVVWSGWEETPRQPGLTHVRAERKRVPSGGIETQHELELPGGQNSLGHRVFSDASKIPPM